MNTQGTINVVLEGRGPLTLRPSNYVATGGEGSIYRARDTIIKLYTDTKKMRRDGMPEKIRLLSALKHPYIVAPSGLVSDERGEPIGFSMPFADGEPLSRVFTTAFWQRESFDLPQALTLVDRMRDTVRAAHDHRAIMVDANELNWLTYRTGARGPEPRAIDVDSWAIGKWGASVIMPSIRDWQSRDFDERSDWFAFAIVSFQVLAGIHPYRGTLDGYGPSDLEKRMKAKASVFHQGVRLNRAVRDFRTIPAPLLEWYVATLEKGERSIPPSPFDKGVGKIAQPALTRRSVTNVTGRLVYDKRYERTNDPVIRVYTCGVVLTSKGVLVEVSTKRELLKDVNANAEIVRTPDGWVIGQNVQGNHEFTFVEARTYVSTPLPFALIGLRLLRYENRLFLVTESELVELQLKMLGKPLLTIGKQTQVLRPHATQWFDGVGVQKAFDASFMVLPFGLDACTTVRVRELDGLIPITAVAGNRFVSVIGVDPKGTYHRLDLTFTADYAAYAAASEEVDSPHLNLTMLPKGVGATIRADGELTIFVPTNGAVTKVADAQIATDMLLGHIDDLVVYVHEGVLWSVRMN